MARLTIGYKKGIITDAVMSYYDAIPLSVKETGKRDVFEVIFVKNSLVYKAEAVCSGRIVSISTTHLAQLEAIKEPVKSYYEAEEI